MPRVLALGFVVMMIFGVAPHVLPRFAGVALIHDKTPIIRLWLAAACHRSATASEY
ncbi:MAG: hypothetical protein ABI852_04905 [Gemmatimonadaceae bacterium]